MCGICGGDGQIGNAFGATKTCPGCHGSGRRSEDTGLNRDVTKTKPSHHKQAGARREGEAKKPLTPITPEGVKLADEVRAASVSAETKTKLLNDIVQYEASHGGCTLTFSRKIRKLIKPAT